MPTDKSQPDDEIIDLTDIVPEESADAAPKGENGAVDMSFEKELDDLFGDVDDAAKTTPHAAKDAAASPEADDAIIDLTESAEDEATPPEKNASAAPAPELATPTPSEAPAPAAEDVPPEPTGLNDSEAEALLGDLPETSDTAASPADSPVDISDLPDVRPLGEQPAPTAASNQPIDLDALDDLIQTAKGPESEPEAPPQPDAGADALTALGTRLEALEQATSAVAGQLRTLLDAPDVAARLEQALDAKLEHLRTELAPPPAPAAEGNALAALRAELLAAIEANKPAAPPRIEDLRAALAPDFDALRQELTQTDQWVTKADLAEAVAATKTELLEAIQAGRPDPAALMHDFTSQLESRLADLRRELPGPEAFVTPDGLTHAFHELRESLSQDLAAALETARQTARDEAKAVGDALASRIDSLEANRVDPEALTEQVRQAVLPDIPDVEGAVESAKQAAKDEAKAVGDALTTRLDALEADRVDPEAITERIQKALMAAIPDVPAAIAGLRESLSQDLATALEDAEKTSKEAADAMGQALSERLLPLEKNRIDQHALDSLVKTEDFQKALTDLRAEIADDIVRRVPQAAAAVIREEIASLVQELGEES